MYALKGQLINFDNDSSDVISIQETCNLISLQDPHRPCKQPYQFKGLIFVYCSTGVLLCRVFLGLIGVVKLKLCKSERVNKYVIYELLLEN